MLKPRFYSYIRFWASTITFDKWSCHVQKAGEYCRQANSFALWRKQDTKRKVLPIANIMFTDEAYADWPTQAQSVLLTRQLLMNAADGLCWMTISECVVQLVIDNCPYHNAKKCITLLWPALPAGNRTKSQMTKSQKTESQKLKGKKLTWQKAKTAESQKRKVKNVKSQNDKVKRQKVKC